MKYAIYVFVFLLVGLTGKANAQNSPVTTGRITGTVSDAEGEPAIGAYVLLEGAVSKTTTDVDGRFDLANVPYGNYVLTVSYVGAEDLRKTLSLTVPQLNVPIRLATDDNVLTEATVVGKTRAREQQEQAIQVESVELRTVSSRVKDIGEVVERLPGVNVRGSGSFGGRVNISLNGLNGTAVRTYLDGLPLEFVYPQFTINNIPVSSISRVDVYKGVVPINIGSDALGGGVNIITEQKNTNELNARYSLGQFNTHRAAVSGNYGLGENVSVGGSFTYNYSDNNYKMEAFVFEDNERREVERFHDAYSLFFGSVHLDVRDKKWTDRFRFTANFNDFYKEIQHGGSIPEFPFGNVQYEGNGMAFTALYNKALGENLRLETISSYSRSSILFVDTTANLYSWSGAVLAYQPTQRGELTGNSLSDRDFDNYANRVNLRWALSPKDEILLSNLAAYQKTTGRDETVPLESDPLPRAQKLTKNVLGLQYERKLLQDQLTLSAAGKLYYYDLLGTDARSLTEITADGKQFGYYATAKYAFNERVFLRSSFESALRIPTFSQFFGNGGSILPNVSLDSETSDNFNLGVVYQGRRRAALQYNLTLNGFLRNQRDIIYLTSAQFQQYQNAEEVETRGVEGSVSLTFRNKLRLDVNATRLQQVYGDISDTNPSVQFLEGTDFPNVPKFFYNLRLSYNYDKLPGRANALSLYAQYKHVDEFNFLNVSEVYDHANYIPVQRRVDCGFRLIFNDGKYGVALNANNLFDADIFDNFSIPRPGRNFNCEFTYRLVDYKPQTSN